MVTGVIKNKIDKIWTDIWAGGITNPLTVIGQRGLLIRDPGKCFSHSNTVLSIFPLLALLHLPLLWLHGS